MSHPNPTIHDIETGDSITVISKYNSGTSEVIGIFAGLRFHEGDEFQPQLVVKTGRSSYHVIDLVQVISIDYGRSQIL